MDRHMEFTKSQGQGAGETVPNVDDLGDPILPAAFSFFCRHLVTMNGQSRPLDENGNTNGPLKSFSYPGVILSPEP